MSGIFIIDDDMAMEILSTALRFRGHDVERIDSMQEAIERIEEIVGANLIVLDIIMAWPDSAPSGAHANASKAGMEVLREIRKRNATLPLIIYSATQDSTVIDAIEDDPQCLFISKWAGCPVREFIAHINNKLGLTEARLGQKTFIVHGPDDRAKLELKNFLQNTLLLPEPVVLHERPSLGRTIVEKFEDYADISTLVFVILTPDDVAATGSDPDDVKRRARQNVIFEMGYFLGLLGRESGRVIFLYRPPIDLPSDLSGIAYIDISDGVEAVGEQIRREIENVGA